MLLSHALACLGATVIVTQGRIGWPLRRVADWLGARKFIRCSMCVGFWVGALGAGTSPGLAPLVRFEAGLASSALAWGAYVVLARLGALEHVAPDPWLPPDPESP